MGKVFDPFFTTQDIGEGTGLGLSLTLKIIQDHNGRGCLQSKPGARTKFQIFLPSSSRVNDRAL
ncbi:MAG: ATP-binding protein [Akkermansiaceae bacterium]